jgi:hypothetical protein
MGEMREFGGCLMMTMMMMCYEDWRRVCFWVFYTKFWESIGIFYANFRLYLVQ